MRTAIAAAALLAVSAGTPRAQDVETGKASFRKCVLCHSIGENAKNKVGPELNGLDGRIAGAVPGFPYSRCSRSFGNYVDRNHFQAVHQGPAGHGSGYQKGFRRP